MSILGFLSDVLYEPGEGEAVNSMAQNYEGREVDKFTNPLGYIGLKNQGATCYLNSLLQCMYLTTEFRSRIWALTEDDLLVKEYMEKLETAKGEKSPRKTLIELQILFARLKLLNSSATSTKALTDVFGWGDREGQARVQHDIQELNRILMSVIDSSLTKTHDKGIVQELYSGEQLSRTHCLTCKHNSDRKDSYWDISVTVDDDNDTLEKSLYTFIKHEKLDGNNQYRCSMGCNNIKSDALRSQGFISFPRVLTFTLNRIGFDYNTMKRKKNCQMYTFPMSINMSPFLSCNDEKNNNADNKEQLLYDLYAVVIHSGSAYSGHYHAYIRESDNDQSLWYNFNDSTVTPIPMERIESQYGGNKECAYMLMYRERKATEQFKLNGLYIDKPKDWLNELIKNENTELEIEKEVYYKEINAINAKILVDTKCKQKIYNNAKNIIIEYDDDDNNDNNIISLDGRESIFSLFEPMRSIINKYNDNITLTNLSIFHPKEDNNNNIEEKELSSSSSSSSSLYELSTTKPFYYIPVYTPYGSGVCNLIQTFLRYNPNNPNYAYVVVEFTWGAQGTLKADDVHVVGYTELTIANMTANMLGLNKKNTFLLWNGSYINNEIVDYQEDKVEEYVVDIAVLEEDKSNKQEQGQRQQEESSIIVTKQFTLSLTGTERINEFKKKVSLFSDIEQNELIIYIEKPSGVFLVSTDIDSTVSKSGIRYGTQLLVEKKNTKTSKALQYFIEKQNQVTITIIDGKINPMQLTVNKQITVKDLKVKVCGLYNIQGEGETIRFRRLVGQDRKSTLVVRETESLCVNEIDNDCRLLLEYLALPNNDELDALIMIRIKDNNNNNDDDNNEYITICDRIPMLINKTWTVKQCKMKILAQYNQDNNQDVVKLKNENEYCLYRGDPMYEEKGKIFNNEHRRLDQLKLDTDNSIVLYLEEGKLPIIGLVVINVHTLIVDPIQIVPAWTLNFSSLNTLLDLKMALYTHESGIFSECKNIHYIRINKMNKNGQLGPMIPCDELMLKQQGITKAQVDVCVEILSFEEKDLSKTALILQLCCIKDVIPSDENRHNIIFEKKILDTIIFDGINYSDVFECMKPIMKRNNISYENGVVLKWFKSDRSWHILRDDDTFYPCMVTNQSSNNKNNNTNNQQLKTKSKKSKQRANTIHKKPYLLSSHDIICVIDKQILIKLCGEYVYERPIIPTTIEMKKEENNDDNKKKQQQQQEKANPILTEYACSTCTFVNPIKSTNCEICGEKNPHKKEKQQQKSKNEKNKIKETDVVDLGGSWDKFIARCAPPPSVTVASKKVYIDPAEEVAAYLAKHKIKKDNDEEILTIQYD